MNKISNIISMPIISLFESEYIGIVYNLMFNIKNQKCEYILVFNDDQTIPQCIKFENLYKIGKDCIYIKNKSYIDLKNNHDLDYLQCFNPINTNTYDTNGTLLGTIKDVILKNNKIKYIYLNNGNKINSKDIFNIGKSAIIINTDKKIKLSTLKPNTININNKSMVVEEKISIVSEKNTTPTSIENSINNKIITDVNFLLNRILQKDILAYNGEIIAKYGTKITKAIINKASQYGKLIEIARHSKK